MGLLRTGSKGDEVRKVQQRLNELNKGTAGYVPLVEDGSYGPKTDAAVRSYQTSNKLTPDGIVGPLTSGSLFKTKAVPVSPAPVAVDVKPAPVSTPTQPKTGETKINPFSASLDDLAGGSVYDLFKSENKAYDYTQYDPGKDAGYKAFRDKATLEGNKAYDSAVAGMSIPGLQDSSIGRQVAEGARSTYMNAIQDAIPEFMDKDYSRFTEQRNFDYKQERDYTQDTGYRPVDTSNIPAGHPLRQIKDYQAEINKRTATDPNDPLLPILKALRYDKVIGRPEVYAKYGSTVEAPLGMETADSRNTAFNQAIATSQDERSGRLADAQINNYITDDARQERLTDAQIENYRVDNARLAAGGSGPGSGKTSSQDIGILIQGMLNSGNPSQWLEDNADWLGGDDYKILNGYAKGQGVNNSELFANATKEQRDYYKGLKDIYLVSGGSKGQYKDNPEAALNQLQSQSMNSDLLGSLYPVLEAEIQAAVEKKSGVKATTSDPLVDRISNEMLSSEDPLVVIRKYAGQLTAAQIKTLTGLLNPLTKEENSLLGP